jgi:uncharacterized protein YggE
MSTVRILAVFLLMAVMLAGSPAGGAPAPFPPAMPAPGLHSAEGIVVTGRGTVEATPDRSMVTVGAQFTRSTAQEAQEHASTVMNQILRQITALGIPRDRIQTVEIDLFPQRRPSGDISGYQAIQRIRVTVDDLNLVGRVIDAAVAAGANLVDGVAFTLRDPAAYRTRAFAAAVQDARATANAMAAAAGVTLLRIVRVEEFGTALPVRVGVMQAPEASTPVLPGTLMISVQVRVVYAI